MGNSPDQIMNKDCPQGISKRKKPASLNEPDFGVENSFQWNSAV